MQITFDPSKNRQNLEKHGVSLADAVALEWDTLIAMPDRRKDYGEQRFIGFVLKEDRLFCIVFTDRGDKRRLISLRKANAREVERYVSEY